MTSIDLHNLIQNFNNENLVNFIEWKNQDFKPIEEEIDEIEVEGFEDIKKLGEIQFSTSDALILCSIKVTKNLTERSGKKAQFDLAKKVLNYYADAYDGIFVFYDDDGNFRFSLIYANYFGNRKSFSNYRRFTYFVSRDLTNNTFRKRMETGDFSTLEGIKETFSVEKVTKEFYSDISNWFDWAKKEAKFPAAALERENGNEMSVIRLITRMIFLWFMQVKGFISSELFNEKAISNLIYEMDDPESSSYYHAILQNLFFATLSKEVDKRELREDPKFRNIQTDYGKPDVFRYKKLFKSQDTISDLFTNVPFLNGGLFSCLDIRKDPEEGINEQVFIDGFSDNEKFQAFVPKKLFFGDDTTLDLNAEHDTRGKTYNVRGLLKTFERFNFTIDENTPDDQDVALDPELLGQVFENLLARVNPETSVAARKETGSFYTPREIVDFMVDESLVAFFQSFLENLVPETTDLEDRLRSLISYHAVMPKFTDAECRELINAIDQIKVLDPAVGSGAFPMGMLNKLVYILGRLDSQNEQWKELQYQKAVSEIDKATHQNSDQEVISKRIKEIEDAFDSRIDSDYGRKLYIIRNSIYGVDFQPMAIHIAKLRFFISLIVEQKIDTGNREGNFGILPLPNLETKFIAANSILHRYSSLAEIVPKPKLEVTPEIEAWIEDIVRRFEMFQNSSNDYLKDRYQEEARQISFKVNRALKPNPDFVPINVPKAFSSAKNNKEFREFLSLSQEESKQTTLLDSDPTEELKQKLARIHAQHFNTSNREEKKRLEKEERKTRLELSTILLKQKSTWGNLVDKQAQLFANWDMFNQNSVAPFFDPEIMFDVKTGFDIVIGNPPYIQLQNLTGNRELQQKYATSGYRSHDHNGDLYCLFYEMGNSLLKWRTGILAYITSNKWMRAGYGKKLRDFFSSSVDPILLIDFAGQQVFKTATVDVNILIFRKSKEYISTKAVTIKEDCLNILGDYINQHFILTSFKVNESWVILDSMEKSIKEKIEAQGTPLSDWNIKINYGIKSGFNDAFIINGDKKDELIKKDPKSAELIRPMLRGKDIKRYKYGFANEWIILASFGSHKWIPENYPVIFNHLNQFKPQLQKRGQCRYNASGQPNLNKAYPGQHHWLELDNNPSFEYLEVFSMQKIMWAELARTGNSFILDDKGYMGLAGTFILTLEPDEQELVSYEYLVSILNHPLTLFSLENVYSKLDNTGWQWKKAPLLKIRIPKPDLSFQSKISDLYQNIIQKNSDMAAISELDREIFKYYGLTNQEIAHVFSKLRVFSKEAKYFI